MIYEFFECGCVSDGRTRVPCRVHERRPMNEKRHQLLRWIYTPYPLTTHEVMREVKHLERLVEVRA